MTCYGGVSAEGAVLSDAWTLSVPAGVTYSSKQFFGDWALAAANLSAPRPGPRADHWLLSVRGGWRPQSCCAVGAGLTEPMGRGHTPARPGVLL